MNAAALSGSTAASPALPVKPVSQASLSAEAGTYSPRCSSARGTMKPDRPRALSSWRRRASRSDISAVMTHSCETLVPAAATTRSSTRLLKLKLQSEALAAMSGEDVARLLAHETTQNDPSAGREIAAQPPRHLAQRPRQNVGQHEVIGSSPAHAWSAPTVRHPGRDQRTKPVSFAFDRATRTDCGSISTASTRRCSRRARGHANIPLPVPHIDDAPRPPPGPNSSARSAPRVEPCSPDPKARPASNLSVIRPATGAWCKWLPRTANLRPISCSANEA